MKGGFYSRMALDGIRKNRQLYLPYLMTCGLMAAVYYILYFLSRDPMVLSMRGGSSLSFTLGLGRFVIVVFSILFLFYTHSFLIRRRKKDFGLYNVLGMDKRNIARILLRETLWSYALSMGGGLSGGVALSKLAQLFLFRLVSVDINYRFIIEWKGVLSTLLYFALVFLLILLDTLRQIRFSNPIELVKSENLGEQPPKARWVLGAGGAVLLAAAYYLAVSIQQPLEAVLWFFAAVLMVIVATYLLFIAGSVTLCKLLQRNKRFYYQPRNFVSVSSMSFRMKRNGAGLASICILLTMVLVMLSSTACLYFGKDEALRSRYPRDICAQATVYGYREDNERVCADLQAICEAELPEDAVRPGSFRAYDEYCIVGLLEGDGVQMHINSATNQAFIDYSRVVTVHLLSEADYNAMSGKELHLGEREALMSAYGAEELPGVGELFRLGELSYRIAGRIDEQVEDLDRNAVISASTTVILVVKDREAAAEYLSQFKDYNGDDMLYLNWLYQFDTDMSREEQDETVRAVAGKMEDYLRARGGAFSGYCDAADAQREDFFGTFGGLFFIGLLLSVVFLLACVLMIYYKQLSEGYEDQGRFAIMRKLGMTKENIRAGINSQMLTVFLLPVAFAVLHLSFAFPMVEKVLLIFGVVNRRLFLVTNLIGVGVTLAFYTLVYRITGNAYYRIVSGNEN